jgi:hypothetical protein
VILKEGRIFGCHRFHSIFQKPSDLPIISQDSEYILETIADYVAIRYTSSGTSMDSKILSELSQIGFCNIVEADPKRRFYSFRLPRNLLLTSSSGFLSLNHQISSVEVPQTSIASAYKSVHQRLTTLEPFFQFLDRIDAEFDVLKPDNFFNPARTFLPSNETIHFDPFSSSLEIAQLKARFSNSGGVCGVCESCNADFSCPSMDCGQPFHTACLNEWFKSDPRTVRSFGKLHGTCPFCDKVLSLYVMQLNSF